MEIPHGQDGEDAVVDSYNELVMVKKRGSITGRIISYHSQSDDVRAYIHRRLSVSYCIIPYHTIPCPPSLESSSTLVHPKLS